MRRLYGCRGFYQAALTRSLPDAARMALVKVKSNPSVQPSLLSGGIQHGWTITP